MNSATTTSVKTVCPYCGVGCGMALDVQGGKVVKVSGIKTHPTNFGRLREQGALLWAWVQEGAHVYVCGDAGRSCAGAVLERDRNLVRPDAVLALNLSRSGAGPA